MSPTRPRRAPDDAHVLGRPELVLHDEDRAAVISALADLLLARALADEAREAAS